MNRNQAIKFCILFLVGMWLGACGEGFRGQVVDETRMGQIRLYAKRFDILFEGAQRREDHQVVRQLVGGFGAERQTSASADGQFAIGVTETNCSTRGSSVLPYSSAQLIQSSQLGGSFLSSEDPSSDYGFNLICVPQEVGGESVCNQYIASVSKVLGPNRVGSALILLEEVLDSENIGRKKLVVRDLPGLPEFFIRPLSLQQFMSQCQLAFPQPVAPTLETPEPTSSSSQNDNEANFGWIEDLFDNNDGSEDEPLNPFTFLLDEVTDSIGNTDIEEWFFN